MFRGLLNILIAVVILFLVSTWLQRSNSSWEDLGNYLLDKGVTLAGKVLEDINQMDWKFK